MATTADGARAFVSYPSPQRLYGLCWSTQPNAFRLAVSSFIPGEYVNKLQILHPSASGSELVSAFEIDHPYPPTKVMWSPQSIGNSEFLATTADYLRLWNVTDTSLERHVTISNKRNHDTCAPLTSFDWNQAEPHIIGTSSIDTTCTIWDLNHSTAPKQQIIAHDDEVYDIAFSSEPHMFASVGGDGSIRLFDLRALESSEILYECPDLTPLLRVAWNKHDNRYIAGVLAGSSQVVVVDLRNPALPILIKQHAGSVNSISWSEHTSSHLCTAGEDRTVMVHDVSASTTVEYQGAKHALLTSSASSVLFQSKTPINQIRWSPTQQNCIALCDEDAAHVVQL